MLRKLPRLSTQSGGLMSLWIKADLHQQKTWHAVSGLWNAKGDIQLLSGVEKRRQQDDNPRSSGPSVELVTWCFST